MRPFLVPVVSILAAVTAIAPVHAGLLDRIGVMGDSLSSEYTGGLSNQIVLGQRYRSYMSWVEQLADDRHLNFGPSGNWSFPRNQGFRYNFASVYNVDTSDLLWERQHTGLAAESPTLAVLEVGSNDFFFHAQAHAMPPALTGGLFDGQDPMTIVPGMLARYRQAMETVAGTTANPNGTAMVLCTVPDITRTPIAMLLAPGFYPGSIDEYRAAIQSFNAGVRQIASERGFAVLDMHATLDNLLGPLDNPVPSVTLAGIEFQTGFLSATPQYDLFLHDGFHPGSVVHGLLANEFIRTVNDQYGANILPLSQAEIVINAGQNPLPEVSSLVFSGTALLLALATFASSRRWAFGRFNFLGHTS